MCAVLPLQSRSYKCGIGLCGFMAKRTFETFVCKKMNLFRRTVKRNSELIEYFSELVKTYIYLIVGKIAFQSIQNGGIINCRKFTCEYVYINII